MGAGVDFGVEPGDILETAMLSPCVGGLMRTWTNERSRLWGVADPSTLSPVMGQGIIARTLREERRFREVALLNERTGTLLLQPRRPTAAPDGSFLSEAREVQLTGPGAPTSSPWSDFKELLGQAVRYTVAVDGFLLVERGGWNAPPEPFCLFLIVHEQGEMSVVEAAPAPIGARFWESSIQPGAAGATMSTSATDETLAVVPLLIIDACATWGLEPWDLALTYGTRS
jgi:hypothetical protein